MNAVGIIFSNIYDNALSELTRERTVASLPFAARYRQIDFLLSNMANSGMSQIGIITKYNYRSLMDHLGSCAEWDLNLKNNGLVILAPYATSHSGIYRGKLEALYNSLDFLETVDDEYVILSDSVAICAMDFRKILAEHVESGCDVTAVVTPYKSDLEKTFPIAVELDGKGNVRDMGVNVGLRDDLGGMAGMGGQINIIFDLLPTAGFFNILNDSRMILAVSRVGIDDKDMPHGISPSICVWDKFI